MERLRAVGVPAGQPASPVPPKPSRKAPSGLDDRLSTGDISRSASSWEEGRQDRTPPQPRPAPWAGPCPPPRGLHTLPAIHRSPETPGPATSPGHAPAAPPLAGARAATAREAALHPQGAGARFRPDPGHRGALRRPRTGETGAPQSLSHARTNPFVSAACFLPCFGGGRPADATRSAPAGGCPGLTAEPCPSVPSITLPPYQHAQTCTPAPTLAPPTVTH